MWDNQPKVPEGNKTPLRLEGATDVQALRDLAQGWRDVSYRCRYEKDRTLHDEDPGPHMTAIQLEWAARKIEELRDELYARD